MQKFSQDCPVFEFQWIIPSKLAVSGEPYGKSDYAYLIEVECIKTFLTLKEFLAETYYKSFSEWVFNYTIKYYHVGTKDNTGFTVMQFNTIYHIYTEVESKHKPLLMHCAAGHGRTSTALIGLWMKLYNKNFQTAYNILRDKRKILGINNLQLDSLLQWEKYLFGNTITH